MQTGQKSEAKKLVEKIVELDPNINWNSLRRAMKTFIITDDEFLEKLQQTLIKAGIPA
jgi:hypothetical protein